MATVVFSVVGGLAGSAVAGPTGAAIGQSLGALGGGLIDRALFSPSERAPKETSTGDIHVQTSTEGAPIQDIFGTARTAGQIIWATPFQKHTGSSGQGKGGGGGDRPAPASYYTVSLAVGLGRGEMGAIQNIWADGQILDMSSVNWRFYKGTQQQEPDPLIERSEDFAPAYRGLAYVVFENLDLSSFGNRLPQFSFEVTSHTTQVMDRVRAISLIPAATEFGYNPELISRRTVNTTYFAENQNNALSQPDWMVSLDQLAAVCPNCEWVSLVVAWFGTSLDASICQIKPKVIANFRRTIPHTWAVGGMLRAQVDRVSLVNERPAYGGTPADFSVINAIKDLKRRGYKVMLHPFILMDTPGYPWRGSIAPTAANGTAAITPQIEHFFNEVSADDFSVDRQNDIVRFTGSSDNWGMFRFILHYAHLCELAGGVDAFLLGSELGGITRVYNETGTHYLATRRLRQLANLVKTTLPNTKLSYGANWDEYRGHDRGGGKFYFHLDGLWSDPNIDFVGIQYYMPLADWRDGTPNIDQSQRRASSIYDLNYLRNNIKGGEGHDWYYLNTDHRNRQQRSPITDGLGKPWTFRWKDISSWWQNEHYHRIDGTESSEKSRWIPGMKPIWFTETGCAAADKSANQPNVFIDLSSLDSNAAGLPYYSTGARDDFMQNRYLEAILTAFDPTHENHLTDYNVKIGDHRMVDPSHMFIWCWDVRPYPDFPNRLDLWSDGVNWAQGHWLNGRATFASVPDAMAQIMTNYGFTDYDTSDLRFSLKGLRVDRLSSARDVIDALMMFYFFDAVERNGKIHFIHRDKEPVAEITADECVITEAGEPGYQLIRAQETELPKAVKLIYTLDRGNYHQAVAEARRLTGTSSYVAEARLPLVADQAEALAAAQSWLHETLIARERAILRLPPSRLALEPGDVITFICADERRRTMRITSIRDEGPRIIEAVAVDPSIYRGRFAAAQPQALENVVSSVTVPAPTSARAQAQQSFMTAHAASLPEREPPANPAIAARPVYGPPLVEMMDLPHLRGDETLAPHIAIHANPRPDVFAVYRSFNGQYGWQHHAAIGAQAAIGIVETPIASGLEGCWDERLRFRVRMLNGELMSRAADDVLAGANYAAIKHQTGWEIIQFRNAEIVRGDQEGATYYEISGLLRGLAGTESEMRAPLNDEAPFVLLESDQIVQLNFTPVERGVGYHWRVGAASQPYSSIAYHAFEYAYRGINLRPLSPVHLRGEHLDDGGIALSWIRRTRSVINDGWGEQDVALGENSEIYEIDILKQGEVVRTLRVFEPHAVYTAAQQAEDFGPRPQQLSVRIYQISDAFGRGAPREETLEETLNV